jgi:hypothetical protein
MNLPFAVLFVCTLPLWLLLGAGLARIIPRHWPGARHPGLWTLALMAWMITAGLFALRTLSRPMSGVVIAKGETLEHAQYGLAPKVWHDLRVSVRVPSAPLRPFFLSIDAQHFDALRTGDAVKLRGLQWGPFQWTTLDALPWWDLAPDRLGVLQTWLPAHGAPVAGTARLEAVRTVREAYVHPLVTLLFGATSGGGAVNVTLPQPFEELTLRLTTPEGAEVVAFDRIDAGSGGVLQPGTRLAVTYPSDRPRDARIVGARRSYATRNAGAYDTGQAIFFAGLLVLVAGACYISVRRRAAAANRAR